MNNELLVSLLSGDNTQEISSKSDERKKIYREYENAVKMFLENGVNTDKIGEMVAATAQYCNDYVDLLNMGDLVQFISDKLLANIKSMQEKQVNSIIEHAVYLGKISALYSVTEKKKEELRKDQEYRRSIDQNYDLRDVLLEMVEDNISFKQLCKNTCIEEKRLHGLLNNKIFFNIRIIGQQQLVSLAPEGKKLQNYLKRTQEKRYSQEDVENYIYMNSHHLINMFRQPKGNLTQNVTVISLSDIRQKCLSLEFNCAYNEIRQSYLERDFSVVINKVIPINEEIEFFDVEAGRKENEKQKIRSKYKKVSRTTGQNIAIGIL